MRYWTMSAAGLGLLVLAAAASNPASAAGASRVESQAQAPIVLAQNERKEETVTHKVKRKVKSAWRNLTGYKFDVGCPILLPVSHTTCTETARAAKMRAPSAKRATRCAACRMRSSDLN